MSKKIELEHDFVNCPLTLKQISVIAPFFNEQSNCTPFFDRIVPILEKFSPNYEIICIDDGSRDNTLLQLLSAHTSNNKIKIVELARNFGKEYALAAGLEYSQGDGVIPIDADLQDPPELIPQLIEKWLEGNSMVIAVRANRRQDSWIKRITANMFYRVINRLCEIHVPENAGDFRLIDRKVVDVLKRLPERTRFNKGLFAWVGFPQAFLYYERPARQSGFSKWRFPQLWKLALDGIVSFSTLPLRIWTYLGFLTALAAVAYMFFIIFRTLFLGIDVPGYASLLVTILFFSGMNMIGLGIMGEYLSRIFLETKQRPLYIVKNLVGIDHSNTY